MEPFEGSGSFTFSLGASAETLKDIESEIGVLEDRIKNLAQRKEVQVQGMPILQHLIGLTQDKDELRNLGKALVRMSELTPRLQELYKRKSIIEMAKEDPRWLMATFADFSSEIEAITNNK